MSVIFDDLLKKYREFDVATLKIKIDGNEIPLKDITIQNLEVQIGTGLESSFCTFDVFEIYDLSERSFDGTFMKKFFTLGKEIEVYLGYIETTLVFKGYVESVNVKFSEYQFPSLEIECLDVKGLMMHGVKSISVNYGSYADAVNKILGNYSNYTNGKVVDSSLVLEREIQQNKETDYSFLCRLAKSINYEFFVLAGKIYFRKPGYSDTSPLIVFGWGEMLLSFSQKRTLSKYVNKVTVKGYDDVEHKAIEGVATNLEKVGMGSKKPDKFSSELKSSHMVIIDYEINTIEEAKARAEAELNKRSMYFITGKGKIIGIPEIVPGKFIEIKNYDSDVDNIYYVTRVIHKINNGAYFTEFEAGVNML